MIIDYNGLENTCTKLDQANKKLEKTKYIGYSQNIPSDFEHAGEIKEIRNKIETIISNTNALKQMVKEKITATKAAEANNIAAVYAAFAGNVIKASKNVINKTENEL